MNFSDKAAVEKNKEYLMLNLNEVMFLPFEPNAFMVEKLGNVFNTMDIIPRYPPAARWISLGHHSKPV